MTTQFLPNAPFVNYFFLLSPDPTSGANVPNAAGTLTFYEDENHGALLATYSDVSDPDNPVVNPNPIELGADGSAPLIYLQDALYFIIERDVNGATVRTYSHYYAPFNGSVTPSADAAADNLLANGQFTYPIEFWELSGQSGLINAASTAIAWGWIFRQDALTTTQNVITFNPVYNDNIQSNPLNEAILTSSNVQGGEETKDFVATLGSVNFGEGETFTFSMQGQNKIIGSVPVILIVEKIYGAGGSPTEQIGITTFSVTQARQQLISTFTLPTNENRDIGFGYTAINIILRVGVGQIVNVGFTNMLVQPNTVAAPVYPEQSFSQLLADIVGNAFNAVFTGLYDNYLDIGYNNGQLFLKNRSGQMFVAPATAAYAWALLCDNRSLNVSNYTDNIPNRRLYDQIGDTYGGAGDLIVTSSANNVIFTSGIGAIQNSAYTPGNTSFTVANTVPGLLFGVNAALTSGSQTSVDLTWVSQFAPQRMPTGSIPNYSQLVPTALIGNWAATLVTSTATGTMTETDVAAGSPSTNAIARISFNTTNITEYRTNYVTTLQNGDTYGFATNMLEFASVSANSRGTYNKEVGVSSPTYSPMCVTFSVDGSDLNSLPALGNAQAVAVPFLTARSLEENVLIFIQSVANPFVWTVTVNAAPLPSQYFLYSSDSSDYYVWFQVDGIGVDPAIMGRTGVQVNIQSTDSPVIIAAAIAAEADSLTFNLPEQADLPTIPGDPALSAWFINL